MWLLDCGVTAQTAKLSGITSTRTARTMASSAGVRHLSRRKHLCEVAMNFLVTHILKISKENCKPMATASDTLTFSPSDQGHLFQRLFNLHGYLRDTRGRGR